MFTVIYFVFTLQLCLLSAALLASLNLARLQLTTGTTLTTLILFSSFSVNVSNLMSSTDFLFFVNQKNLKHFLMEFFLFLAQKITFFSFVAKLIVP